MFTSDVIIAFITGVLGPISLILIKNHLDKKKSKKPDMVLDALKISKLVNNKLEDIRDEYKADRAWVAQFHNGGNFYPTGKSMAKFSFLYETVSANASSIQPNFQNIPVNLFSKSLNELLDDNVILIPDFKDETIATFGLKYIAEQNNCKSGYMAAIKTIDEKFIGILGLDYTKRKVRLTDEQVTRLEIHSSAIGGVLMNEI
jgi:hypothetical protein